MPLFISAMVKVINDGTIVFTNGKITSVGTSAPSGDAKVIDCTGKQVYPGLILADSYLGLVDIGAVRAERDEDEIGDLNPDVRSVVAYNTDSKIINTVRSNGILLANIVPRWQHPERYLFCNATGWLELGRCGL